jgi:hypothetical protein
MLLDVLPLIPWQLALGATGHVFKLARLARLPRTYSRLQPTVVYARQVISAWKACAQCDIPCHERAPKNGF